MVVIIGGGPAGSAAALFLKQLSIDSVIIEREEFPRFHIGESLTAETGRLLRELGLEEEMNKHSSQLNAALMSLDVMAKIHSIFL